jgi:hypothetical protein
MKLTSVDELHRLESEIASEASEAFYHIGQKLLRIKTKRLYEAEGFASWAQYCKSGRIEYQLTQADRYIRAAELRPKLPAGTKGTSSQDWTLKQVIELAKCETDNDAVRVAQKAIDSGKKISATLIAQIRDGDEETGRATAKHLQALKEASLENHLEKFGDILTDWRVALTLVEPHQWDLIPEKVISRLRFEWQQIERLLKDSSSCD